MVDPHSYGKKILKILMFYKEISLQHGKLMNIFKQQNTLTHIVA